MSGNQDLQKSLENNNTNNKAKRSKTSKNEVTASKKQRKEDIRSIVGLMKFANELDLSEQKQQQLDNLVAEISVKSLSPVVGNETDNMNCDIVIKRFAKWEGNPPESNPPPPDDPDKNKSVQEMSTPEAIRCSLKAMITQYPKAKIKLLPASVNLIAYNTGYTKTVPEVKVFEEYSDQYIVFQMDNIIKFKNLVFPPVSCTGENKEDESSNKEKTWREVLQGKLHIWRNGGWICNLEVMSTRGVKAVVLYKSDTHSKVFREKNIFDSEDSESSDEFN